MKHKQGQRLFRRPFWTAERAGFPLRPESYGYFSIFFARVQVFLCKLAHFIPVSYTHLVASMVVYVDGRPLKRDYRRFKLKDMEGPDDYASMEQVLTRRFRRYLDGDEKFVEKPDLLLIDGGLEHVRVARRVLEAMALDIPAFGMVKDCLLYTSGAGVLCGTKPAAQADPAAL